jgi:uncharacterized repeat protein (TIGR03803 family)
MQATNGKLYGMTLGGGSNGVGAIFSLDPTTSVFTKLKDLNSINGADPYGSLMQATDGKLYGLTYSGGSNNLGAIFSYDLLASTYKKLKDLDYSNGANPYGNLVQASDGKLYGMTSSGGLHFSGVTFSYDPLASVYKKLNDFDNTITVNAPGCNPYGSLIQAADGRLYGLTSGGGSNGKGVIFSLDPLSSTYTKLKDFDDVNYTFAYGDLLQATNGKLYGLTSSGGKGHGDIFSFDISASTYTKLKDFGVNEKGSDIVGSLIRSSDGKLYGMTSSGGTGGAGVIFSFDPLSSTYTKLRDFDYASDGFPIGSLIQASDGRLYGLVEGGDSQYIGAIFSFDLLSSKYSIVKYFDGINGSHPTGLLQAKDGKLYGLTASGGTNNSGVIFSFDPSSSIYSKLKDFDNSNGADPVGGLLQAVDGKLYGMTYYGGNSGKGVIFSFNLSSSVYTKLRDLDSTNGGTPNGSLIQASDGKLYGMTTFGGSSNTGVIFSFDPSLSTYKKLKDFDSTNGKYPYGSLVKASDGKLYGTALGGSNNLGVIFSYDPLSFSFTKLKDYDGFKGSYPNIGSAFIEVTCGTKPVISPTGSINTCQGTAITLTANSASGITYQWLKNGLPVSSGTSKTLIVKTSGSYRVIEIVTAYGCKDTSIATTINVVALPPAIITPQSNLNICVTGSVLLQANSGTGLSYQWKKGSTNIIGAVNLQYTATAPGSYVVQVTNSKGCIKISAEIKIIDSCSSVQSDTLEAEQAVLNGAIVASDQPGFTGSGFADYKNASGDYIEWTANVQNAGSYSLKFRYSNGGTTNRPLQLMVNGAIVNASLPFVSTGGWSTWSISSANSNLVAGANKIRLTTTGSNGPNLDHLILTANNSILEAEDAVLSGAVVASTQTGYTGSGYADYVNASGDYIEWTANAQTGASYSLQFRYANGGTTNRPLQLQVNGVVVNASLAFATTGGWTTWSISSGTANLIAGNNKIKLTTMGSNGPNVDNLSLTINNSLQALEKLTIEKTLTHPPGLFEVSISPNPVTDHAKLIVSTSSKLPIIFKVIDVLGRMHETFKATPSGYHSFDLSIEGLSPGTYFIIVKQGNLSAPLRLVVAGK